MSLLPLRNQTSDLKSEINGIKDAALNIVFPKF